jgi:hypothetical protein
MNKQLENKMAKAGGTTYFFDVKQGKDTLSIFTVVRPWGRTAWTDSILGLNVIVPDWRRLFTTATALPAAVICC